MPVYNTNPINFKNLGTTTKKIDFNKARARVAQKQTGLALDIPKSEPEPVKQGFLSKFNSFLNGTLSNAAADYGIGVGKSIFGDYKQGGQDIIDSVTSAGRGEQSPLSAGVQTAGTVAKTAFSLLTRPLEPLLKGVADKIADIPAVQKVADTNFVGERLADISFGMDAYSKWAKQNPELSKNIEAGANIGLLVAGEKPAQKALQTATDTVVEGTNAALRTGAKVAEIPAKVGTVVENAPAVGKDLIGKGRDLIKPTKPVENIVGEVTQAKDARGLAKSQKALTEIDTTGVETYADLNAKIKQSVKELANQVDETLAKDTAKYKPADLTITARTEGGDIIKTDYVSRALRHLEEIYTKSGDDLAAANIKETVKKYLTEGLTKLDVNDLSRLYGMEAPNGFNKLGDALTSFNAKASETIRSGLKEVARSGMDDTAQNLDMQISNLKTLEGYTLKMEEAVQGLTNKIEERNLFEKVGRVLGQIADVTTGGFVKSFFNKFLIPSNVGNKIMNSLDLQARLARNLELIQGAGAAKSDKQLLDIVKQLVEPGSAAETAPTATKVPQLKSPQFEQRSALERSPIVQYIKNNPPAVGLSIRDVGRIDKLTKDEMVQLIDYARLDQPYSQSLEDAIAYLAEKYNLKGKTPLEVADELEDLIVKAKKTEKKPMKAKPKAKQPQQRQRVKVPALP